MNEIAAVATSYGLWHVPWARMDISRWPRRTGMLCLIRSGQSGLVVNRIHTCLPGKMVTQGQIG